ALHEDVLSLRRSIGDPLGVLGALEGLGQVANLQGNHLAARRYFEEALAIADAQGDTYHRASVVWNLGLVAHDLGDLVAARAAYEEAIALDLDAIDEVNVYTTLALLAQEQGDFDEAEMMAHRALARYRAAGNPRLETLALANLGGIALARG